MSAIVLDTNKINSYVLPNLKKSENIMQTAYNTSVSLKNSLPSSFYYRTTINYIVNQIYRIKKEIKDIDKIIETKVERANSIQRKADSRVSSLSSAVSQIGATVGGAVISAATGGVVGAAVGAATGAAVATVATKPKNNTGAKQSKSFLSKVGDFFVGAWDGIKKTASKIAKSVKSIWEKFSGSIKNIGKKVVDATKKVGKAIFSIGAKIAKGVVSGVKKFGSAIVDGFKWVGSKVVSGVKTAAKWVKDTSKTVTDWIADKFNAVKDWTSNALKSAGAWISKAAKASWAWIKDAASTVWTHMKKIGASFVNGVISLVKGVVKLIEAIIDLVILVGAGVGTIGTAIWDTVKGLATGKWDWSATKGLWKGTKAVVAYDWTSKCIFDPLYNTSFGKWLDDNAYSPFKSTGIGCKILEGIGYVAGVIAISCVTFGVGGVALAAPTAASMAATATAAGIGKYTQEEWNKNSLSITYGDQEINLAIDYEKYSEIEKLKDGQSTTLTQQLIGEDGKPFELKFTITRNGDTYSIVDSAGNVAKFNGVVESNTAKGLLVGGIKGAWEGAQYYVGGKIGASNFGKITNSINNPTAQVLARSGIKVGLDTLTGVAEVPFQSAVTMFSECKNWKEAWEASGGWKAVGTQAGIAGLMSFIGEGVSLKRNLNVTKAGKELDAFFQKYRSGDSGYGVDQGITRKITGIAPLYNSSQLVYLSDKLVKLGLSTSDALLLLKTMDSAGVCSYASVCNEIFDSFRSNPEVFESFFGFPMFTTLDNGAKVLNSSELLVDLFVFENSAKNGGSIFYNTPTGELVMDRTVFLDSKSLGKSQKYMNGTYGQNVSAIDSYLKSKNPNLEYSSQIVFDVTSKLGYNLNSTQLDQSAITSLQQRIDTALSNKKQLSLGIYQHQDSPYSIKMKSMDTGQIVNTKNWNERINGRKTSGHSIFITGSNKNGVFVSSWGEKYFISYDDLSYAPFVITESTITGF